jgi:exonuclease III
MGMRFETWNVRSMYRAGSLKTVGSELTNYNVDLVAVQEVRWENDGIEPADDHTFFFGNGCANHHLGTGFLCMRKSDQQL